MQYVISLNGCDDSTRFVIDLTEAEKALMERIIYLADKTSEYSCMPTMELDDNVAEFLEEQQERRRVMQE